MKKKNIGSSFDDYLKEEETKTIEGIIETQKLQTETIKELMGICTELVDRVKTLEENFGIRN